MEIGIGSFPRALHPPWIKQRRLSFGYFFTKTLPWWRWKFWYIKFITTLKEERWKKVYSSENTYDINGIETPPYLFVCMFHYLISLKKIEIAERYLPYLILCTCHKRVVYNVFCLNYRLSLVKYTINCFSPLIFKRFFSERFQRDSPIEFYFYWDNYFKILLSFN